MVTALIRTHGQPEHDLLDHAPDSNTEEAGPAERQSYASRSTPVAPAAGVYGVVEPDRTLNMADITPSLTSARSLVRSASLHLELGVLVAARQGVNP